MENINTSTSSLQEQKPALLKDKSKIALIVAIMYLLGTIILGTISNIFNIISEIEYYNNASPYVSGPEAWLLPILPTVVAFFMQLIPYTLFFIYLLAFYKKNPAHGLAKTSYIIDVILKIFGIVSSVISSFLIFRQDILFNNFNVIANILISIAINMFYLVATFIFCITFFSKFKLFKVARIFSIATAAVYIIRTTVYIILDPESYAGLSILYIILNLIYYASLIIFWFVCIDADTHSRIPVKQKPVPYPVAQPVTQPAYQAPVQPVTKPVYQPPVQPVAKPVYQPPVQPVAQPIYQPSVQPVAQPAYQPPVQNTVPSATSRVNDAETTLNKLKRLLDEGLITQEDFDKKKAEILEKM